MLLTSDEITLMDKSKFTTFVGDITFNDRIDIPLYVYCLRTNKFGNILTDVSVNEELIDKYKYYINESTNLNPIGILIVENKCLEDLRKHWRLEK